MTLLKELQQVKDQHCEEGVLTIFLNTDQTSNDQQKGEWKIRLKNGLKKLEEYTQSSEQKNLGSLKKLTKKANIEIKKLQLKLPKSLVLIAFSNGDFYLRKLQLNVSNEFHWEKKPMLQQLEKLQMNYPEEGILFIQKEQVYMIETSLNEITNEARYVLDLDDEDWKQYEGVAARERMASSANHRDKFEQRHKTIQQRWFKEIASKIEKIAAQKGWKHIYLVGENDLISEFKKTLSFKHISTIRKNYTNLSTKEILHQVIAS